MVYKLSIILLFVLFVELNCLEAEDKHLSLLPILEQEITASQQVNTRRKHLGTHVSSKQTHFNPELSSEDNNDRWLFMLDSGKPDDEEFEHKKITPKSVFIAPLLSRAVCKDGYRFDHLGKCSKIIKLDPSAQLDFLLKRLSEMYSKTNFEDEEEAIEPSAGPLQISLPISHEQANVIQDTVDLPNTTSVVESQVNFTVSVQLKKGDGGDEEYSGFGSGDGDNVNCYTTETMEGLEDQYLTVNTTEVPELTTMYTETESEITETTTESTTEYVAEDTTIIPTTTTTESRQRVEIDIEKQNVSLIKFPDNTNDKFGTYDRDKFVPSLKFNVGTRADFGTEDSRVKLDTSSVDKDQYWWLPDGWKYDDIKQNPSLLSFWAKLPLVKDISFVDIADNTNKNSDVYEYGVEPPETKQRLVSSSYHNSRRNSNFHFPQSNRFSPSQPHRETFKASQQVRFESYQQNNPWMKRTDHDRHRVRDFDYNSRVFYRSTIKV